MRAGFPRLSLFIGPPSGHGLAVNQAVRDNRPAMVRAGLDAYPTRLASPALRSLADLDRTLGERQDAFAALAGEAPAFYSALNFLGAPHRGLGRSELFPEAESQLGALAEVAGDGTFRVVLAPDALPDLFLAAGSEALEARVRTAPWELLYHLNWAELVAGLCDCLPGAEVLVLTHAGTALGGPELAQRLFGPGAGVVGAEVFLRESLNATGRAVLSRMEEESLDADGARELYRSFADRADEATCSERLGIDRLTRKLLMQRFDEDLEEMSAMDRVEVI